MEVRRMRLDTVMPGQNCVLREIELPATQRARLEAEGHTVIRRGRTNFRYYIKDYEASLFSLD